MQTDSHKNDSAAGLTRRTFLTSALNLASITIFLPQETWAEPFVSPTSAPSLTPTPNDRPVNLIHQTDLFRPHNDPDDHFDLACVYALAQRRAVNLLGILGDFPPHTRFDGPDIAAVAMLNHLTGLTVPLVTGMAQRPSSRHDLQENIAARELVGVNWLLSTLRKSPEPVVITVVGSCKDVALAGRKDPKLFAKKCRAVYLNAGTGAPKSQPGDRLEYNVQLDPASYSSIFDLPCPIYWMPCFGRLAPPGVDARDARSHGTFYRFEMGQVLPHLSPPMQRFFLSMLEKEPGDRWLRSLKSKVDPAQLDPWGKKPRAMWCTAGFCHLAGWTITQTGSIVRSDTKPADQAFRFAPVQVTCKDNGRTQWKPGASQPPRYKFEVTNLEKYASAMTEALKELLQPLG